MKKDMYKLDLNDSMTLTSSSYEDTEITRVPGGWIYCFTKVDPDTSGLTNSSTFVPFNNEFQNDKR
jgi:hypothetical protein